MEQCVSKEENRYIDLYYNDVYGLTISLDQIKRQLSAIDISDNFVRNQDITAKILVEYVKGIFIEKYFISQSIANTRNYIKFMK